MKPAITKSPGYTRRRLDSDAPVASATKPINEPDILPALESRLARNLVFPHLLVGSYIVITAVSPYLYGPVLAVVVAASLVWALLCGSHISRIVVIWSISLVALGIFGTIIGSSNGNPGTWATMSVFVVEPLMLAPLCGILYSNAQGVRTLIRVLDCALLAMSAVGLLVYLATTKGASLPTFLVDPRFDTADLSGDTLRSNYQGYNSLVFLAPYGLLRAVRHEAGGQAWYRGLLLLAALASVILSGRRILYLTTPGVILILLIVFLRTSKNPRLFGGGLRLAGLGAASLGGLAWITQAIGLNYASALTRTVGQFTLSDGTDLRATQAAELLDRWGQSPIVGWGTGAVVPGYVRNIETPWAFELTYHTLLLNFGIVGFGALAWWGGWIVIKLFRGGRAGSVACQLMLAGFMGTILACSVDPYVLKFDGMWMVFAPFGVAAGVAVQQIKHKGSQ